MNRKLQILALAALLLSAPLGLRAEMMSDDVETEMSAITLSVNGTRVRVSGAEGEDLEAYNLTGQKIVTLHIDGNEKTFNLSNLPKGCYIIKVGKVVRKVNIR